MVAIESDQIVGHIFFSPVAIEGKCADDVFVIGLASIAVHPDYQRQGIGALLIRQGLAACAEIGCKAAVVLGSPAYYPRLGFAPACEKGLKCKYDVPDEAFMELELEKGALQSCSGTVKYRSEFSELE